MVIYKVRKVSKGIKRHSDLYNIKRKERVYIMKKEKKDIYIVETIPVGTKTEKIYQRMDK